MKNAVCIVLQNGKKAMEKDTVIRETARLMGYARTGKLIADSIERGIAYGRKTGEIVLTPEKKFKLAE